MKVHKSVCLVGGKNSYKISVVTYERYENKLLTL